MKNLEILKPDIHGLVLSDEKNVFTINQNQEKVLTK